MLSILNEINLGVLVFEKRQVWKVDVKNSVKDALSIMKEHKVLSVPVYDSKRCQYVGILNTGDILKSFVLGIYFKDNIEKETTKEEFDKNSFEEMTVSDLMEKINKEAQIYVFEPEDSIDSIIEPMTQPGPLCCFVKQKDDSTRKLIYKLVSKIDLIKFLNDNCNVVGGIFERTVENLKLKIGKQQLMIGKEDQITLDIYQRMWSQNISAVPILNKSNQLIATLSSSDLKEISKDNMNALFLPVNYFLKVIHGEAIPKPIVCYPTTSLKEVMKKIIENEVHRVWVVTSSNNVIDVLSCSDIIFYLREFKRK